jgi:anti-anti-sigma regulatory factor
MLKVRRSEAQGHVTFALSGRIEGINVPELRELLGAGTDAAKTTLDLAEVKLVDQEAIKFLASCEARVIQLKDCPSYIRRWIEQGSEPSHES